MNVDKQSVLSESLEDYLEAIYHLVQEHKVARAKQVASLLDVGKSSVTGALNSLAREGLVNYEPYQFITLTPEGEALAQRIARRHEVFKSFLRNILSVEEGAAEEAACRLEHAVRGDLFERFVRFLEFVEACPRMGLEWIASFEDFCAHGPQSEHCASCLEACVAKMKKVARSGRPEESGNA